MCRETQIMNMYRCKHEKMTLKYWVNSFSCYSSPQLLSGLSCFTLCYNRTASTTTAN